MKINHLTFLKYEFTRTQIVQILTFMQLLDATTDTVYQLRL